MKSARIMRQMVLVAAGILVAGVGLARSVSAATTPHPVLAIGSACPDFSLQGVDGKTHTLAEYKDAKLLVIVFTCNHCATAQAYEDRFIKFENDYKDKGVQVVAICGNDPQALQTEELCFSDISDSLDEMKIRAKDKSFNFPYLYDGETQKLTQAFGALATPHVFIFDADRKLRYQGQFDNQEVKPVTSRPAINAIEEMLAGKTVTVATTRAFGCSTKWSEKRAGVETATKKWEAKPVTMDSIDDAGVAKLVKNDTKNLLVVNVWATWCGPCVEEMPDLVITDRMFTPREFTFVTISGDEPEQKDAALALLQKDHVVAKNFIYTGSDKDKLADALDKKWEGPFPYTLVIAPGGRVIYRHANAIDQLELRAAIVNWLGRTAAGRAGRKNDE